MAAARSSEQTAGKRGSFLARHPLASYFFLAFAWTWLLLMPGMLVFYGKLDLPPQLVGTIGLASLLGPVLSGGFMTWVTEGPAGFRDWLRAIVRWRVGLIWYLIVLIGLPLVMLACTVVWPGVLPSFDRSALPFTLAYAGAFVSMAVMGGPLCEEPGWTGFAQPRLQERYGPLVGGLFLGTLWAVWHLPEFLVPSQSLADIPPRGTVLDFVVFAIALIGLRLVIVWVVNNCRGSVLMAILVHASWNTFYAVGLVRMFPTPAVLGSYRNLTLAGVAMALLLILMTRGKLGARAVSPAQSGRARA